MVVIEGTPIAVDFWRPTKAPQAQLFFLTHLHADHTQGLTQSWRLPIYTSPINALLLKHKFRLPDNIVRELEVGESYLLSLDSDNIHTMTVTVIDANHIPGAVMYLFQGYFGNILYCGDMRWCRTMLNNVVLKNVVEERQLDVLYLDNTFSAPYCTFPSRHIAKEDLFRIIDSYPDHIIKIGIRDLGREDLLEAVAQRFCERIMVQPTKYEYLQMLKCSDVFTTDADKARIHAVPMTQITVASHKQWNNEHPTISIILTALYVGWEKGPYSSSSVTGIFIVPYSDHSSFPELIDMVTQLAPHSVLPIVKQWSKAGWWSEPQCPDQSVKADMSVYSHLLTLPPPSPVIVPESVLLMMKEGRLRMLSQQPRRCGLQRGLSPRRSRAHGVRYSTPPDHLPSPPLPSCIYSTPPRSCMHSLPPHSCMHSPQPCSGIYLSQPQFCMHPTPFMPCMHSPPAQSCAGIHSSPQACTGMHPPPPQHSGTGMHSPPPQQFGNGMHSPPSKSDVNSPCPTSSITIDSRTPSPSLLYPHPHVTLHTALPPSSPSLHSQSDHREIQAHHYHPDLFSHLGESQTQARELPRSVPEAQTQISEFSSVSSPNRSRIKAYSSAVHSLLGVDEHFCEQNSPSEYSGASHHNKVSDKNSVRAENSVKEPRQSVTSLENKSSEQHSRSTSAENLNVPNTEKTPVHIMITETNDLIAAKYTRLNNEGITVENFRSIIKDTEEICKAVANVYAALPD